MGETYRPKILNDEEVVDMKIRNQLAAVAATAIVVPTIVASPALAGGGNYAEAWESWMGARWNGYVQIQASHDDGGQNAKQGYHRFTREAGPSLDTGRMYTAQASSPSDSQVHSRQDWVWDSPLWGDKHTTKYNYDFLYW